MSENTTSIADQSAEKNVASVLQSKVEHLTEMHGDKTALELLRVMIEEEFVGKIAAVASFGADSAILLHLIATISKGTPVIFLETGKHFPETLEYREHLVSHFGLTNVRDEKPVASQITEDDPTGELWKINTDYCCYLRKVLPLERSLDPFDAWITGRKRFQSESREKLASIELVGEQIKINPLAGWHSAQLKEYFVSLDLPKHPLSVRGYPSIGCAPCTKPVEAGEDERSGRWADSDKTECGIHKAVRVR